MDMASLKAAYGTDLTLLMTVQGLQHEMNLGEYVGIGSRVWPL